MTFKSLFKWNNQGLYGVLVFLLILGACKDPQEEDSNVFANFDFQGMAENYQTVASEELDSLYQQLVLLRNQLQLTTAQNQLDALKSELSEAMLAYQKVEAFEWGKASQANFRLHCNTFPVDTAQLNDLVADSNYNFDGLSHIATQGFPALDYLIFSGNDSEVMDRLNNGSGFRVYADTVLGYMIALIDEIKDADLGLEVSLSGAFGPFGVVGRLVNEMVYTYELSVRARVGIPLGKYSAEIPLPEKVEAVFSGESTQLLEENLRAIEQMYLGYPGRVNGIGIQDLVMEVDGGEGLNSDIEAGFNALFSQLNDWSGSSMDDLIQNVPQEVNSFYQNMKQLTVKLKVDMTSKLGVMISYQDNDGD